MGQGAFTCGPDVPGIRVNAGTGAVECRVSVTNAAGEATLSLDGGATWIAGTNGWFAVGSALAVTVKPPSPGERRTWLRTSSEASLGADGTSFSVAFLTKPFDARLDSFTPTHVWTGAAGTTAFDTAENWTNATADAAVAAPGAASDVFVPVGCTMNPIATVPFAVKSFRIGALTNEAGTATFTADTACTNEVSGDLAVYPGGTLTHTGPEASPTKRLAFAVGGDMTVCTNGSIDVRGKGYTPKHWPGYSSATGALSQNGGLHARNYGSAFYPVTHGSGGGWSGKTGEVGDGRGSGVVYLSVAGTLTIDGTITSDWYVNKEFCGAGGSIQLHAASYAGRGSVTANGAKGSSSDSADGGRIALYVGATGDAFAGTVTAYGGGPTATRPGACGTIYRCRAGEDGHLLLDARGRPYVIPTPLAEWSLDGTDARLASLAVTNGAVAQLEPGITLRITESWDARGGTVTNAAGSHVVFEPASTGRVHGVNSFYDVSCAASGKALVFGTGAAESVSVRDGGTIDFHGAEGAKLALLPDGAGVWSLAVSKAAAYNLQYLAVSNSNASAGTSLTAVSSEDLGGNTFWSFPKPISPGDPIEWTGAVSADWFDPGNWKDKYDQPRAPVDTDRVIIPSGRARNPVIGSGRMQINALTVAEGARLTLQACTATVTNALAVNGTLAQTGGGKLSCGGDVSFAAAAALEAGTSTIALTGSGSQTVSAPGVAFCHLHVTKSGGAVTFVRGFSARELRASVASSEVALTFGAGETFAVSDLILAGELAGEPGLVLESGQSGSPWYLNATGVRFVSAVAVSDSDASGGKPIPADALSTGADTRNVNWTFSGSSKLWTGAADKFFDNAANWSPVGAPGADANVLIMAAKEGTLDLEIRRATSVANFSFLAYEATATLLVSNAVTVTGETKFGGNVTVTMKTEEAWTTGGDYTLETGVTLTHTGPLNPPKFRVAVSAGGSIAIASGALVTADGKGRVPKAAYWGTIWNTGSHGGKAEQKCYGSVFWPVLHGSCGGNENAGKYAYGGGVIRLAAQGDVTVDGKVTANGLYDSFSGAGGSVWITCGGALKGSGAIQSIGGVCSTSVQTYCGAGGRISVQQGAATRPFVGLISARGCKGNNAANSGGAGTVYFSCGGNPLAGELLLSNNGYTVLGTQLPMADDGDPARAYRDVRVVVTNAAVLEVTAPLTLRDVDLAHAGCRIDLGTNTLTVLDSKHRDGRRWAAGATVTCTTNATDGVYGKIVWKSQGTRIVVR